MQRTILLIEDNTFDAKVFRRAMQEAGIEASVIVAKDGVEALAILEEGAAGLDPIVVTDLNMPRMSGLELLRKIRGTVHLAHLPVFVLTTSSLPSDRDEAMEIGIKGYIRKTDDEQDLIQPIAKLLKDKVEMSR